MNKKILLIMMCVMVMTLSLTAISAVEVENSHNDTITGEASQLASQEIQDSENELLADNSNIKTDTVEENLLKSSDENDILTDNEKNFTSLQELIDSPGNYVELNDDYKNYYDSDWENPITINKNLTINGKGHYIDAVDSSSNNIFKITGDYSFTLTNVTLKNANYGIYTPYGVSIYKTELTCENVTFDNVACVFKNDYYYDEFSLTLNNITFENYQGNLINIEDVPNVKINISNTKFDNNPGMKISQSWGVTAGDVSITLNNVEVTNLQDDFISIENYQNADINFTNTTFNQNSHGINIAGIEEEAGDINLTLKDVEFKESNCNPYFYITNYKKANINVENATFDNANIKIVGMSEDPGDISIELNNAEVTNQQDSNGFINIEGFFNTYINITNTNFTDNTHDIGIKIDGASEGSNEINLTLNHVEFTRNTGSKYFDINTFKKVNLNINDTKYNENDAFMRIEAGGGGDEHVYDLNAIINNSEFKDGIWDDNLIAFAAFNNVNMKVEHTTINSYRMYIQGSYSDTINLTLNDVEISDLNSNPIYIEDYKNADININNTTFNNAHIRIEGRSDDPGDISIELNNAEVTNQENSNNFIYIDNFFNADINITNTNFTNNNYDTYSGIEISGVSDRDSEINLALNHVEFTKNSGSNYFDISTFKKVNLNINDTTYNENTKFITITAGNIYDYTYGLNVIINNSEFKENTVDDFLIDFKSSNNVNITVEHTTINKNGMKIEGYGDAINLTLNDVEISDFNNYAIFYITNYKNVDININNTTFTGGIYGIYITGTDDPNAYSESSGYINFTSNTVKFEGDHVFDHFLSAMNFKNANINLTNTNLTNSQGIRISGVDNNFENGGYVNLILDDSEFTDNGDESGESIIKIVQYKNANINFTNTTFKQNKQGIEITGVQYYPGEINFTLNTVEFEGNGGQDSSFIKIDYFKNANINFTNTNFTNNYGIYINGVDS
ncbi:hypothetical protein, partial [Methanobrevibacter sp.]